MFKVLDEKHQVLTLRHVKKKYVFMNYFGKFWRIPAQAFPLKIETWFFLCMLLSHI